MNISNNSGANYRAKDSSRSGLSGDSNSNSSQPSYMVTSLSQPLAPVASPTYIVAAKERLLSVPSIYSLGLTGLLNLVVLILVIYHREALGSLSIYQTLCLILFMNIALGIHGLLHMGSEAIYGFNPLMEYFN